MIEFTSDYHYCEFPFQKFNPLQQQASKYFTEKCNLFVSASVAAGKTVIHQAIASYELSRDEESKVVYTCPLKSIAEQKFLQWSNHQTFKKFKIVMLSSDRFVTMKQLQQARIIVATIQSINVCCRRCDKWIQKIRLLTFDQAHLFNHQKRGSGSEALMMNLCFINKNCRILCLSGTLPNIKQIAKWIKGLNGLQTCFIDSKWRPTKLYKRIQIAQNKKQQIAFIKKLLNENLGQKILIFVHSKKTGQFFNKQLRKNGIRSAFYSSDLTFEKRKNLIQEFKDQMSDLVLICTNSLSMGINL